MLQERICRFTSNPSLGKEKCQDDKPQNLRPKTLRAISHQDIFEHACMEIHSA